MEDFDFEGKRTGATRQLMSTSAPPDKGMLVGIPIGGSGFDGLHDLLPGLKALAFERQGAQDLPPRFDQIQVVLQW
jgi:hypothetical protein